MKTIKFIKKSYRYTIEYFKTYFSYLYKYPYKRFFISQTKLFFKPLTKFFRL